MPRRIRLPVIRDGKSLLKLDWSHVRTVLCKFLGYMPVCYTRLTVRGLWAEIPAELALEFVKKHHGASTSFWYRDLRVVDNWDDNETQIERWNNASTNS